MKGPLLITPQMFGDGWVLFESWNQRRFDQAVGQVGAELSSENQRQLWVPVGFAHGFLTLSDQAEVLYKASGFWSKTWERSLRWSDPEVGITWPLEALHQHGGHAGTNRRLGLGIGGKAFEVKGNGVADLNQHLFTRWPCCHTAGQIGHIGREVVIRFFDHNGKGLVHGKCTPDCRAMLLRVPGARLSLGFPATVTRPGRCGCLNCRWLPRVAKSTQPACSKALITARIFTAMHRTLVTCTVG